MSTISMATLVGSRLRHTLLGIAMTASAGAAGVSMAGTVELSPGPPSATTTVAPNLVLTFDDSGSMTWHHMPDARPYDNSKAWVNTNTDQQQGDNYNRTYNSAAPYLCAGVINPGVTDTADPLSWSMNGVYFNPNNTYEPPIKADGSTMPNASYAAAWENGIVANRPNNPVTSTKFNLGNYTGGNFCGKTSGGYYKYTGPALQVNASTGQLASTTSLYVTGNWTWVSVTTDAQKQNFANWYSYYRTRTMAAVSSVSRAFSPFNENVRLAWQNINANTTANPWLATSTPVYKFVDGAATNNVRTRFYNWLFAMPATGGTQNRTAAMRVGSYFTNRTGAADNNPYWDRDVGKELVCRQNFHIQMTDGMWNGDTPAAQTPTDRTAIGAMPDGIGRFSLTDRESRIVWGEDNNTVVTMADIAFKYWATDLQAGVTGSSLFATVANRRKVPPSLPDQSTSLFGTPLPADADPRSNREIYWNPANDPATWPHLVQYMIGFGASGTLTNNATTYQSLRLGTGGLTWPVPAVATDDGKKIDDMWHAALNSRGAFFAASNPAALTDALKSIINSIVSRSTTSVAGSISAAVLTDGSVTYQAGYDTNDWKGSLTANKVNTDGTISTAVLWNGRTLLDTRAAKGDSRVILTSTKPGAGFGAAFTGSTVVDAIRAVDPAFGAGSVGADQLAWLRGDRSKEGTSFRQRNSVFGAVINAQTLYVAEPNNGYRDVWPAGSDEAKGVAAGKSYEQFRADHAKRAPTLYVAANDGMLHAFDATTEATTADSVDVKPDPGAERWAYVPYSVYGRLAGWSALKDFSFMPSVDGTPVSRDVYFGEGAGKGWHTLLVGGLRLGGRGVYALDITEPTASQGGTSGKVMGPADKVLWEFSSATATTGDGDPANLGYTYGRPNIGRLATGKWVVLVPGGYFPSGSTEPAARNTFSSLFVLDAQTGKLIRELKTPTSVTGISGDIESYGLTTPVMGDYNSDQIDDVAFAGDLLGHMWRFDFTSSDPAGWRVDLLYRPQNPGYQPVTVMPRLFPDPTTGGFIVLFGTGKYLGGKDNVIDDNTRVQSIYGLRDTGVAGQATVFGGSAATPLVKQTMVEMLGVRGLTMNPVPARTEAGVAIRGWYIDLNLAGAKGERVVVDASAVFSTNQAVLTTLIPQNNDPCDPEPRGALMVLDAATGQASLGGNIGAITGWPDGYAQAGLRVKNPPTGGSLPIASAMGGGIAYIPGITSDASVEGGNGGTPSFGIPLWRRRSWRSLNDAQ
ncbi:pilus assembly protein [Dyella sedimenti]|uniref:pilus assembly protein n=1 Tax=Dyella sedimenti TaxID=2919947 RepID=UPI001FAB278E|nr:PilC/PilY family type IV pilus protein [Dyella sedimenti]